MTTETGVALRDEEHAVEPHPQMLPDDLLKMASKQATALKAVIDDKKLFTMIGQKKHVSVEGWMTLGAMNSLQAFTESVTVHKNEDGSIEATAIVSARRVTDGVAVAQAEGFCSTRESRWKGRDEYAVRSMAQTRATSKVFRQALAWVMVLAGYEATPVEEVPTPTVAPEVPQIDEDTRVLLEREVITKPDRLEKAKPWIKEQGFLSPKQMYARITPEQAAELLALVGWEFGKA